LGRREPMRVFAAAVGLFILLPSLAKGEDACRWYMYGAYATEWLEQGEERGEEAPACVQPSSGSLRMRLPVAANIAFATAGAIGGVPGSPIPPGASVLGTICTSTFGISFMRSIR